MLTLGIESSCDETAAAVLDRQGRVVSSIVSSQLKAHAPFGGVVPELAARHHIEAIPWVVSQATDAAGVSLEQIEGVAVTHGPGLIGCLLIGVAWSRAFAYARDVPIVGVNHLEGHVVSGWIDSPNLPYPALALVVSGGHTALWRVPEPGQYVQVARTRDDAAGEAFDKAAKLLGLPYPGGPVIDRLASQGDPKRFTFGEIKTKGQLGFSFSGYKTAVRVHMEKAGIEPLQTPEQKAPQAMLDLVASLRYAIVRELCRTTRHAIESERPRSLVLAGGVAANSLLRAEFAKLSEDHQLALSIPAFKYCTDNAAMIACAGRPALLRGENHLASLDAEAGLTLGGIEAQRTSRRHL
jgi:N6-L-threonylcarbamoyladenine synthase